MTIDDSLISAEKPSRYIGGEVNSVIKTDCELSFALAFPDTYEVGMSHLGLQILYSVLNDIPWLAAERAFAPWPDREKYLRLQGLLLTSHETQKPLRDFAVVGFSLQYELSYTNVLNMLELGGIPLSRTGRNDSHPLIIAGGPCCFNPAPLADFIDAFVIGEGEEAVREIAAAVRAGGKDKLSRIGLIEKLARIPGVYAPAVHGVKQVIKKRKVIDLNSWPHPAKPVVPLMQTIHDRIVLEIARGCTRGCRFCQAGMLWRPYRERNAALIMTMAEQALANSGHDEISLLALSSGDYSCLTPLIKNMMNRYSSRRVALALPSLRVESLNEVLIEEIKRTRKTSFTLAPEAGTDRMRRVINKGNTADELLNTMDKVFAAGWKSVKLYFMLGLPSETAADLDGIIDLGYRALKTAGSRGEVTISLSTFVPKPHTPFQWQQQINIEETRAKQEYIRQRIKSRRLNVKWHDARMSLLEGLFSRGDERLGALLEKAHFLGCRFDGWSEVFRFDLWQVALEELKINPDDYLRAREAGEVLPWDNIDCGVSRDFLLRECEKSLHEVPTEDCRFASCQNCGVCDFTTTQNVFSAKEAIVAPPATIGGAGREKNYRIAFTKKGNSRFLSHLELSGSLLRALRRSHLKLSYSTGFHPHPKISFATATSVGMESDLEYLDITAAEYLSDLPGLRNEINSALPGGVAMLEIKPLAVDEPDLSRLLRAFAYELILPEKTDADLLKLIAERISNFLAEPSFPIERLSKGKTIRKDIRPFVEKLALCEDGKKIILTVQHAQGGSARPVDIITHVLGFNDDEARRIRVVKTATLLRR